MFILNEKYKKPTKHWEFMDYFIYPDGTERLINMSCNIVTEGLSYAIASLMKGESGYSGAQYWALGSGSTLWPTDNPPPAEETDTRLEVEFYRKAITASDIVFIDANNVVSASPTNRLQITVTFEEEEANGKIMEFGIFAGNASTDLNSGFMINHKTHPAIFKTNILKLKKTIRFTF